MRFSRTMLCAATALWPAVTQAQCLECAQQMFQATLTTNSWYNIDQDQIDQTRSRDARSGTCYDANRSFDGCRGGSKPSRSDLVAPVVANQAESAVLTVLNSEYRRRLQAYGGGNASQWLNKAAGDTGRQVAALNADYQRRSRANGAAAAGRWYVESARQIATRYIGAGSGSAVPDGVTGDVPAATRKRLEDVSFAVIEPEIRRREKSLGQAKAAEWARIIGTAVGTGVRNLAPEYVHRVKVDGRPSADDWYVEQARSLANRQIRSGS